MKVKAPAPGAPPRPHGGPMSPNRLPQPGRGAAGNMAGTRLTADSVPEQNPIVVLGVGGGAVILVFALFLIFRMATGTLGGPKSPFGDNLSVNFSSQGSLGMSSSSENSDPSTTFSPSSSSAGGANWQPSAPSAGNVASGSPSSR
jgi:hypothetical protein